MESIAVIVGTIVAVIALVIQIPSGDDDDKSNTNTTSNVISGGSGGGNGQSNDNPAFVEISQITSAMEGITIDTRGVVTILNENKGNVYFNLKDPKTGKEIRCVMFAKTNNDNPERKNMLLRSHDNNSVINVKGEIDVYKGELEIKVWQVYQ